MDEGQNEEVSPANEGEDVVGNKICCFPVGFLCGSILDNKRNKKTDSTLGHPRKRQSGGIADRMKTCIYLVRLLVSTH